MIQTDENQIAARSYLIWESEGRPEGKALDHWLQAQSELEVEATSQIKSAKPKRRRTTATAKPKSPTKVKKAGTVKAA